MSIVLTLEPPIRGNCAALNKDELKKQTDADNIDALVAEDAVNVELLMETTRPVALVTPQTADEVDDIDAEFPVAKLHSYAPITTLRDPPYEFSG